MLITYFNLCSFVNLFSSFFQFFLNLQVKTPIYVISENCYTKLFSSLVIINAWKLTMGIQSFENKSFPIISLLNVYHLKLVFPNTFYAEHYLHEILSIGIGEIPWSNVHRKCNILCLSWKVIILLSLTRKSKSFT